MDSMESTCSDGSLASQNSEAAQQARIRFEQGLSCAVCLDRFRDPRLLECNHSFCKQCLLNVLKKRLKSLEESEEDSSKGERELLCPRCRKITLLDDSGVDALPINYDLNSVVEAMPDDTISFSPSTPVLAFGRPLTAPVPRCDEHSKPMEYFCQNDQKLLCGDCLVNPLHRTHEIVIAKNILEKELENIRQNSFESAERMLLKLRESVDNVSNMADSLKDKGEKTKSMVQEYFKEIRDALETREQALLNTTEEIIMRKVTKLEMQKEVLSKSKEDLEIQVLKLKHILANKNDYSFLKNKQKLVSDISLVIELANSKERLPLESTKDGPNCFLPGDLLSSAHNFGEVYCRPCPSKFTARGEGLSKGFIHKPAKFKVEARDRYGQRSVVSGSSIKATIQDPSHASLPVNVEEVSKGEYLVSYTPTLVGYHLIRITADGTKILNGESHAVVFNKKDYFSLGVPHKHISKNKLVTEPPISTMRSICTLPSCGLVVFTDAFCLRVVHPVKGQLVQTIGSYGTGNGQFSLPLGLAVNRQSHIFVTDSTNHRIEKFTSEGRHMITFSSHGQRTGYLAFPEGLAVSGDDKLFVADCGNDRIQIFNQKTGKSMGGFGRKGSNAGQFSSPRDLAVDVKNNRLLVSDTGNYRIQALTMEGKPLTQFGNPKGGSVYLNYPYFVTVDEDGFILVTETRSHFFTVLTPRGALVRHVGSQGDSLGQFRTPYGICVAKETGDVIVTDSTSHCIQIF